jgi:hypothetical protein
MLSPGITAPAPVPLGVQARQAERNRGVGRISRSASPGQEGDFMRGTRILMWALGLVGAACLAGALVIAIAPKEPAPAKRADSTAITPQQSTPVTRASASAKATPTPKATHTHKAVTTPSDLANWAWRSGASQGTWHNGSYIVQNDAWNGKHGPQTIYANSFHEIKVISDQPTGNTEIMTYPDVSGLYTGSDTPVSQFSSIYNTFSESMPSDVIGEAADDIWLNNWGIEIMMWVDTHNEDPGSWLPVIGHVNLSGQNWTVYKNDSEFIFKLDHNETSGTTHVLPAIRWLMGHGYVPSDAGLTAVQFGWEIAGTHGPEAFDLHDYNLVGIQG